MAKPPKPAKIRTMKLTPADYGNGITSRNQAVKGMFFFSGTGPVGATCVKCASHVVSKITEKDKESGMPKTTPSPTHMFCGKALDYYADNEGKAAEFPQDTAACKYYQPKKTEP
ncbi:MAG: hypothetical protein H7Z12_19900 [Rhodospirillaceae bacterium]|nr:hypothetical protein [Rhodospirillales bacterium]